MLNVPATRECISGTVKKRKKKKRKKKRKKNKRKRKNKRIVCLLVA